MAAPVSKLKREPCVRQVTTVPWTGPLASCMRLWVQTLSMAKTRSPIRKIARRLPAATTATPRPSGKSASVPIGIRVGITWRLGVGGQGKQFSLHSAFSNPNPQPPTPNPFFSRPWEPVHPDGVVVNDAAHLSLRDPGEVLRDLRARERPHPFGVRVVRAPHQVIHADQFAGQDPGSVVLERGVELGRASCRD